MNRLSRAAALLCLPVSPLFAQGGDYNPDTVTPEAVIGASYETLQRPPGENFDWPRFRALFLPQAVLIPNAEQTDNTSRVMTVDEFIAWVDAWYAANAPIGSDKDQGFSEEEIARRIERYGDVAQVLSTYQKHLWENDAILARGINSFQLVQKDGRWWVVSLVWDEDYAAGPIPSRYAPVFTSVNAQP